MEIDIGQGVYVGHRAWEYRFEHTKQEHLILRSTGQSNVWRSIEMVADCDNCVEEPPNPDCACGIYALKDPSKLRLKLRGRDGGWIYPRWSGAQVAMLVFGTVVLWGSRIIEAEDGFRAQHARMESLVVPTQGIVPSHVIKDDKTWIPIQLDIEKLASELHASYGVPVYKDTELVYYWAMPEPAYTTRPDLGGRKAGVPQLDITTGKVYKSKSAAGKAVAGEYGLDPYDHYVWYAIIRRDPGRFREATKADVDAWNKAHPYSVI